MESTSRPWVLSRVREFEEKCPKGTNGLELPFWFVGNGVQGATTYNVLDPEMGTFVWKRGLHEINIGGLDEVTFRFEVKDASRFVPKRDSSWILGFDVHRHDVPETRQRRRESVVPHHLGEQRRTSGPA